MSTKPRNRNFQGRRRNFQKRTDFQRGNQRPRETCSMCGKPISDITTALSSPENGSPVHFDCVLRAVKEKLKPVDGEKVIYLGNSSFAVVDYKMYQQRKLKILRRMDWEVPEEKSDWVKSVRVKSLS